MNKKILIIIVLSIVSLQVKSQESNKKNEVSINLLTAVYGIPELNYDRILSENLTTGIALAFSTDTPEKMTIRSMFIPYFRSYFGKKQANGFFIEANAGIVNQKWTPKASIVTTAGIGFAIGYKWISKNSFIGELHIGGGRMYNKTVGEFFPRVGISIGKRF